MHREWFAQSPNDYSAARTNRYIDARDIALMARLGFDHVRLSIDPVPLEQYPRGVDGLNADFVGRLDRAVDAMLADGLAVQIDLQPEDSYKQQLRTSDYAVDRLTMLWRKLAAHYANRDPDRVFFEILNEPEVSDPYRWAGIQARLAAAIRQAAPRNTIIATGPNYSNIPDLLTLHPLADGNVIYNFHFYDPHEFTHQGASWGLAWWSYTHGIPYPPNDSLHAGVVAGGSRCRRPLSLENYWLDHWDARRIRMLIDEAAAWAHENNVPLICNEFGAYRNSSDPVRAPIGFTTRALRLRPTALAGRCGIIAAASAWSPNRTASRRKWMAPSSERWVSRARNRELGKEEHSGGFLPPYSDRKNCDRSKTAKIVFWRLKL